MYTQIISILDRLGYHTLPDTYYQHLDDWAQWYNGNVDHFHSYVIDTGVKQVTVKRYSAGMAKQVCEDWADLLMSEKVDVVVDGKQESDYIHSVLDDNNWAVKANEAQETKGYRGTVAYVPHVVGAVLDGHGAPTGAMQEIEIDYIPGNQIFPLSWHNGIITEVAFAQEIQQSDNQHYIYLQLHVLNNGTYDIINKLYDTDKMDGGFYREIPLDTLPQYKGVPDVVHTHSAYPQYAIDRFLLRANIEEAGPMGIPVYANAIDQLRSVDVAYDSYVNEFVLGKKRVMVKPEAVKDLDGKPLFDTNELVYYVLPEDSDSGTTIKEIDMSLRTEQHSRGVQDMLNMLSHKCGLGNNYYRYDGGTINTATEVISSNSKLFRTLKKHEIMLGAAITSLCRIILRLSNQYGGTHYNADTDITVQFDDSIIEDTEAEFTRDLKMVTAGAMSPWELRVRYLGESADEAKANVPTLADLTGEGVDDE